MPAFPHRASQPGWADVTRILSEATKGGPSAAEQLPPLVYDELRKLAPARLARETPGQSLDATALVHENPSGASPPEVAWTTGGISR